MISVVVPFRDEQESLASLLDDLRQQEFSNYEVILVNDHSSDDSVAIAEQHRFPNVSIVQNRHLGKKAALDTGIEIAKGEIIVTTDADCSVGKHWLESIRKSLVNPKIKFVFGAVGIQPQPTFFAALQRVEFASLIGSGAASSAIGFPTMSNGANLAFRKEAFAQVKGYKGNEHIASGDDEFLMRKIIQTFPDSVKFIPYADATVLTKPQKSLAEFVQQRLRWAGKWRHNSSKVSVALAFFIVGVQLAFTAAVISSLFSLNYSILILLLTKMFLEATFINRVCRFTKVGMAWAAFLVLQIVYPFYVLGIGLMSNVTQPVWKGRAG
ncbi:MAG TPA: glycosyltransferase [Chryseosolibacter sp.]